jgi:hypothetical protein
MTDPNGIVPTRNPNTDAMIDTALAAVRAYDLSAMLDLNEVEMATAIGRLTATLDMLLAAIGQRPATTG